MSIVRANILFGILITSVTLLLLLLLAAVTTAGSGPPTSTLRYGAQAQTGEVGAYCWIEQRQLWFDGGSCVDISGLRMPVETLTVPVGARLAFDFGAETVPSELRIRAIPVSTAPDPPVGQQWQMIRLYEGYELRYTLKGTDAEITTDLRPGEYAIEVSVTVPTGSFVNPSGRRVPTANSASYGFHIVKE